MGSADHCKRPYRGLNDFWFKLDAWPIWAALAMQCGQHPDEFAEWGSESQYAVIGGLLDMIGASVRSGILPIVGAIPTGSVWDAEVTPTAFISWAQSKELNVEFFDGMTSAVNTYKAMDTKERCRLVAQVLWSLSPTMTIQAVIEHPATQTIAGGMHFKGKNTIRDWIKDLDPPGRTKRGRKASA